MYYIMSSLRAVCLASRMSSNATHSSLPPNHLPSAMKVRSEREAISASARVYINLSPSSALLPVELINSVLRQLLLVTAWAANSSRMLLLAGVVYRVSILR